jgi:hypothetical protein
MTRTYIGVPLRDIAQPRPERKRSGPTDVARDVGCPEISPSCLICPLPRCLWEYPRESRGEGLVPGGEAAAEAILEVFSNPFQIINSS